MKIKAGELRKGGRMSDEHRERLNKILSDLGRVLYEIDWKTCDTLLEVLYDGRYHNSATGLIDRLQDHPFYALLGPQPFVPGHVSKVRE